MRIKKSLTGGVKLLGILFKIGIIFCSTTHWLMLPVLQYGSPDYL